MHKIDKTRFWNRWHGNNNFAPYLLPLLLIISFIVYRNLLFADFLDYDDGGNVYRNITITDFSFNSIRTIFTTPVYYSYSPITFLFYGLEWQLFGMSPSWFHFMSILLHLVNIFLIYRFALLLLNDRSIAIISSALFALHPIHMDAVGWISAQSYLLATMFYLLSLISYIGYLNHSSKRRSRLMLSLLFFVFACLSKSQAFTLAPIILLLNWINKAKYDLRQVLIVSVYFCISMIIGLLTLFFRSDIGKTEIIPDYSFFEKAFVISFSIVKYIYKVVYPIGLSAIEPFPAGSANGHLGLMVYVSPVLIIIAGFFMWKYIKKAPLVIFGLLFFFINVLVTQISFLEDGFCANRYFYLSSIGIYLPIAMLSVWIYKKLRTHKFLPMAGGLILIIFLSAISMSRSKDWKDTLSLTNSIIENYPGAAMAYNIRGIWYYNNNQYPLSIRDLDKAISLFPEYSPGYYNRGLSLRAMQDYSSALKNFNRAIELNPDFVSAFVARGNIFLTDIMDYETAIDDFNMAISLDPANARAYYNRGLAYFRMRNVDEACKNWHEVKRLGYSQADEMLAKYCR